MGKWPQIFGAQLAICSSIIDRFVYTFRNFVCDPRSSMVIWKINRSIHSYTTEVSRRSHAWYWYTFLKELYHTLRFISLFRSWCNRIVCGRPPEKFIWSIFYYNPQRPFGLYSNGPLSVFSQNECVYYVTRFFILGQIVRPFGAFLLSFPTPQMCLIAPQRFVRPQ